MPQTETLEDVRRRGRERLYPSLANPNWLVLRKRRQIFSRWLRGVRANDLCVLDVGGRIQPYRPLLSGREGRYLAVDLRATPLVDVVANAAQLPLAGEQFDLVLCTQMLEYSPHPGQVISEIWRVLKPGGILLLSVPSLAIQDSDQDRWRFWPPGIHQLLASFSRVEVVPEGGSVAGFLRSVNSGLHLLARYRLARALVDYTIVPLLNLTGLGLEALVRSRNDAFAVNYSVLARK